MKVSSEIRTKKNQQDFQKANIKNKYLKIEPSDEPFTKLSFIDIFQQLKF